MSRCIVAQGCYICTLASGTTAMSFFHQLHQSSGPISDFDFDDSLLQRSSDEDCALAQESGSRIGPEQPVVIDIEAGAFAPACSCACTAGFWIAFNLLQRTTYISAAVLCSGPYFQSEQEIVQGQGVRAAWNEHIHHYLMNHHYLMIQCYKVQSILFYSNDYTKLWSLDNNSRHQHL